MCVCVCVCVGPGSSESSDDSTSADDGGTPLRTGDDLEFYEEEGDESRSLTPHPKDPSTITKASSNGVLGGMSARPYLPLDRVSDIHGHTSTVLGGLAEREGEGSNSDDNLRCVDSNGTTSDTDHHHSSLNLPRGKEGHWVSRRFESDLSTAPFSSETSDLDTSGNERVATTTDSQVDVNGHSPPLAKRVQAKGGAGKGGMASRGGGGANSGSSGDEVLSRKKMMKKPIPSSLVPAKPPPPPLKKAAAGPSSVTEPRPSQAKPGNGGVSTKKTPLSHTKSTPLGNKGVHQQPPSSSSQESTPRPPQAPSRSLSSKTNHNVRVKPPVGAKPPVLRPTPPPKPQAKGAPGPTASSGGVGGVKPLTPKTSGSHSLYSKPMGGQGATTKVRGHTVTGEGVAGGVARGSQPRKTEGIYKPLPKKPTSTATTTKSAGDEKEGVASGGVKMPPVTAPPSKPMVPTKPRRLSSEKRPHLMKTQASVPSIQSKPKSEVLMRKVASSPFVSDSSKNPSSSEMSGQSQSPSNSPYPSPSTQKRPPPPPPSKASKPSPTPKRVSPTSSSLLANSSKESTTNLTTSASVTSTTVASAESAKEDTPVVSPTNSAPVGGGANGGVSLTIGSPSPPPIPARGYMLSDVDTPPMTSSTSQDGGGATPLSPSPRPRGRLGGGPRRPPPNPPNATPTSSMATPTSNVSTGEVGRRGDLQSPSSEVTSPLTLRSHAPFMTEVKPLPSHYEVDQEGVGQLRVGSKGKERYFEAHQSRETVADVSYAVVKRSSLPRKKQEVVSSPQEVSQDSQIGVGVGGEDATSKFRKKLGSARRAPPKSPRATPTTTTGNNTYESIDELNKMLSRRTTERGHNLLTHKKSFSPPPSVLESEPPPLPSRPAPSKQKSRLTAAPPQTHKPLVSSSSSPNLLEPASYEGLVLVKDSDLPTPLAKTRDPVYDEIPERFRKKVAPPPSSSSSKVPSPTSSSTPSSSGGPTHRPKRDYEEIVLPEFEGDVPRLWLPPKKEKEEEEKRKEREEVVDGTGSASPGNEKRESSGGLSIALVSSKEEVVSRLAASGPASKNSLSVEDLRENWMARDTPDMPLSPPPTFRKRQARSFSSSKRQSLMFQRMSSDRSGRARAATLQPTTTRAVSRKLLRQNRKFMFTSCFLLLGGAFLLSGPA